MNWNTNAAQVAEWLPSSSLWKLYDTPAYCRLAQMLQHLSTFGWFQVPALACTKRRSMNAPLVSSYRAVVGWFAVVNPL